MLKKFKYLERLRINDENRRQMEEGGFKYQYPFKSEMCLYWLGEIPNMSGHCIVIGASGKIYPGYHIEHFELFPEDE